MLYEFRVELMLKIKIHNPINTMDSFNSFLQVYLSGERLPNVCGLVNVRINWL